MRVWRQLDEQVRVEFQFTLFFFFFFFFFFFEPIRCQGIYTTRQIEKVKGLQYFMRRKGNNTHL